MQRWSKKRIRQHLTYSWWKYLLACVLCVMGLSIAFDMTEYRPPAEKKIDLYWMNGFIEAETLQSALWPALQARFPDQEQLTVVNINLLANDAYAAYTRMQYSTYVAARQGDLLVYPEEEFRELVQQEGTAGIFVDLTPFVEEGLIQTPENGFGIGLQPDETGHERIYGVPADEWTALRALGCDPHGAILVVMDYSQNARTAAGLIGIMQEMGSAGDDMP